MNKEYYNYIKKQCPTFDTMPKWEKTHVLKANKIGFNIEQINKMFKEKEGVLK